jgi:hypothetical protein
MSSRWRASWIVPALGAALQQVGAQLYPVGAAFLRCKGVLNGLDDSFYDKPIFHTHLLDLQSRISRIDESHE